MNNRTTDMRALGPIEMQSLSFIDMVTCSLSVIGASSIITCALFKRKVCFSEVFPIFHLSLADILASGGLMVGAILYLVDKYNTACYYISSFTVTCFVCTFLLTFSYALEVYLRMRDRGTRQLNRYKSNSFPCLWLMYMISWILPLSVVIGVLATRERPDPKDITKIIPLNHECSSCLPMFHYADDVCWTYNDTAIKWHYALKYLFIIPLILVLISNLILYVLAFRAFKQSQVTRGVLGFQQYQEERRVRNRAILYQSVFIFCWLPSLILGCLSLSHSFNMKTFYWLYILQAITTPLQGFLNSLVYGWKREGFRTTLSGESVSLTTSGLAPNYSTFAL